jgi:hypothetical protein
MMTVLVTDIRRYHTHNLGKTYNKVLEYKILLLGTYRKVVLVMGSVSELV